MRSVCAGGPAGTTHARTHPTHAAPLACPRRYAVAAPARTRGAGRFSGGGAGVVAEPGEGTTAAPDGPASDGPPFAVLLRRHRQAAGLTQAALAARAGLSVRGLQDLERGARTAPHRETVRLLAEALALGPRPAAPAAAVGAGAHGAS